jgi:hypothetical protein
MNGLRVSMPLAFLFLPPLILLTHGLVGTMGGKFGFVATYELIFRDDTWLNTWGGGGGGGWGRACQKST